MGVGCRRTSCLRMFWAVSPFPLRCRSTYHHLHVSSYRYELAGSGCDWGASSWETGTWSALSMALGKVSWAHTSHQSGESRMKMSVKGIFDSPTSSGTLRLFPLSSTPSFPRCFVSAPPLPPKFHIRTTILTTSSKFTHSSSTRPHRPRPSSLFKIRPLVHTAISSTTCHLLLLPPRQPENSLLEIPDTPPTQSTPLQLPHRKSREVLPLPEEGSQRTRQLSLRTDRYRPP